ncbi:uncharacterized protein LOC103704958 [Phoenix dactylifera]|uniref:Uncharacterized protein LOC103704958 n=1 Tax=Phoenix dactylifera TaxID=42345 RepID=A0A8B8ZLC3_PHODC|nr:uncharacterized protein LOC103704958 [Phoenix dactylifera]
MATMFSISTTFALGPRRPGGFRSEFPATAPLRSPATARPIGLGFRLGNAVSLPVKRRVPVVLSLGASNPETTSKDKADKSSSGVAGGPPLLTILAGLFVFLLVCWVVGSIAMWLVGLIVNVPK